MSLLSKGLGLAVIESRLCLCVGIQDIARALQRQDTGESHADEHPGTRSRPWGVKVFVPISWGYFLWGWQYSSSVLGREGE